MFFKEYNKFLNIDARLENIINPIGLTSGFRFRARVNYEVYKICFLSYIDNVLAHRLPKFLSGNLSVKTYLCNMWYRKQQYEKENSNIIINKVRD